MKSAPFSRRDWQLFQGSLAMTTTTEVSDSLERVDSIVNMLDEICDNMDGFSSAEEAWLSSINRNVAHLALRHARNLRKPGRQQRRPVSHRTALPKYELSTRWLSTII
jgi:hypothetical protein